MESARDWEHKICHALAQLEDMRGAPGFEDVDVDRLRATLEKLLKSVRQMTFN
jgi:hypothetical protein